MNTTNTPTAAPARPKIMRADALGTSPDHPGRVQVCAVCGAKFAKTRKWNDFCSDKCRKLAWRIRRRLDVPADVRATLSRIEGGLSEAMSTLRLLADLRLDQRIKDLERHIANVEALVAGGGR